MKIRTGMRVKLKPDTPSQTLGNKVGSVLATYTASYPNGTAAPWSVVDFGDGERRHFPSYRLDRV